MNIFEGFILGLVQGLTEFLPISSSGHLVLFQKLFGISGNGIVSFDIALHLATLVAVFFVLWREVLYIIKKPLSKLTLLLITGMIPTGIIALAFSDFFDKLYETGASLGIEFILTGVIILFAESVRSKNKGLEQMKYSDALVIGTAQGLAMLPAVSRSGLTIAGALVRGLDREFAAKFSFLISIPAILAATAKDGVDIMKAGKGFEIGIDPVVLVVAMLAAAVSGYFAVRFMIKLLTKGNMKIFAYYVFVIGGLVLIDQLFIGRFFTRLF